MKHDAYYAKEKLKVMGKMIYNRSMKKGRQKKGFTIIEVAIFLAISGALFVMVIANTAIRVTARRYSDAVYDLAEEIRNAYSATINVENYRRMREDSGFFCSITSAFNGSIVDKNSADTDNLPGRTRCAVYGQIVTFGEDGESTVHRYDIIGLARSDNIEPDANAKDVKDAILGALGTASASNGQIAGVKANIVTIRNIDNSAARCEVSPAGNYYEYLPQWNATIENKKNSEIYRGAIMIVRSPISGTIHTYIYSNQGSPKKDNKTNDETFYVQKYLRDHTSPSGCGTFAGDRNKFMKAAIDSNKWYATENDGSETWVDLCVGGEDSKDLNGKRRAIRIHGDGSTESAVEVLSETESNNVCKVVTE